MMGVKINNIFADGKVKNTTKGVVIPANNEAYKILARDKAAK